MISVLAFIAGCLIGTVVGRREGRRELLEDGPITIEAGWLGRDPEWDRNRAELAIKRAQQTRGEPHLGPDHVGMVLLYTGDGDVWVSDDDTVESVLRRWKHVADENAAAQSAPHGGG